MADEQISEEQLHFINLAKQGKDAWNNWISNNQATYNETSRKWENAVNFSNINFSQYFPDRDEINFSGFNFGNGANFTGCSFIGKICLFVDSHFGQDTNLTNVNFGESVLFNGTQLSGKVDFSNSTFNICQFASSSSHSTRFADEVLFKNVEFKSNSTHFDNCHFDNSSIFKNIKFENSISFISTYFGRGCSFIACTFEKDINIQGNSGSKLPSFIFCEFKGNTNFSERSFDTDFKGSVFYVLPNFPKDGRHIEKLDLTNVTFKIRNKIKCLNFFEYTTDSKILLKLRELRATAEITKNHDLERDLYLEERKAERGILFVQYLKGILEGSFSSRLNFIFKLISHIANIFAMSFYWISSNYGRNTLIPICWYGATYFLYRISYYNIFYETAKNSIKNGLLTSDYSIGNYDRIFEIMTLANQIPIIGNLSLDSDYKKFLFCGGIHNSDIICPPPQFYDWILISQNLLSGLLIFLFGLSLRNYFKIK